MKDFIFWKRWTGVNKSFLFFSLFLLLFSFTLVFYFQHQGTSVVADPVLQNNVNREEILLDAFERNYYQNNIEVELFLSTQDYIGGPVKDHSCTYYTFLALVTVAFSLWLAAITKIMNKTWYLRFWILDVIFSLVPFRKTAAKRGWLKAKWYTKGIPIYGYKYFTFITIFALVLMSMNLDAIGGAIDNTINYWFLAFLASLGGLSLYFYSFNTKPAFALRFFSFLLIFGGLYYGIIIYTDDIHSLLHLVAFGVRPLSLLAISVIFYSGYRVFHFFLMLSASEKKTAGKQSLINYIIISSLYMSNALFLLLKDMGYIELEIMYLSPMVMLLLSIVLGLWSQRLKAIENQQNILVPHSLFIYLSGGIITSSLLFLAYSTMNEGLIEILERMVLYANVCVGGTFLLYVFLNFSTPLMKGIPVYNRSLHGDVFIFSGVFFIAAGIIAVIITANNFKVPQTKWKDANYSVARDYYTLKGNEAMSKYYAQKAHNAGYYNLKPNYYITKTLSSLQVDSTIFHLKKIDEENTAEFIYTDLAKAWLMQDKEQFYDAVFTLEEGLKIFPNSVILRNNLATLYMDYMVDSSYKYLMEAKQLAPENEAVATNLLRFKAKGYDASTTVEELDSLIELDIHPNNQLYHSNKMAVARLISSSNEFKFPGNLDSMEVNNENIPLLYNYILYLETQPYEKNIADRIAQKFKGDLTTSAMNQLMAAYGIYQLRKGDVKEGAKALGYVVETCYSYEKPYYANLLAKLLLQNGFEDYALHYFIESDKAQGIYRTNDAYLNRIHLYGKYDKSAALQYLIHMKETGDTSKIALANDLIMTFSSEDIQALKKKDNFFKLRYIHFNPEKRAINEQLLASIEGPEYRSIAQYELYNNGEKITNPDGLILTDDRQAELNYLYINQLIKNGEYNKLKDALNRPLPYHKKGYKAFCSGLLASVNGDTVNAKKHFSIALKRQFFNPDVLLPVVDFYENTLKNEDKAYNLLLTAVDLHKNSIPLNKAYALMCIRLNYNSFALGALADLEKIMTLEDFQAFILQVEKEKELAAKKYNNW